MNIRNWEILNETRFISSSGAKIKIIPKKDRYFYLTKGIVEEQKGYDFLIL